MAPRRRPARAPAPRTSRPRAGAASPTRGGARPCAWRQRPGRPGPSSNRKGTPRFLKQPRLARRRRGLTIGDDVRGEDAAAAAVAPVAAIPAIVPFTRAPTLPTLSLSAAHRSRGGGAVAAAVRRRRHRAARYERQPSGGERVGAPPRSTTPGPRPARAVRAGAVAARQARRAERVRSRLREQEKRAERRAELLRAELGEVPVRVGCAEPEDAHRRRDARIVILRKRARKRARRSFSLLSIFLTPHNRRVSGSGRSAATGTSVLRSASAKHASRANASSAARARASRARGVPPQTSRRARRAPRGVVAGAATPRAAPPRATRSRPRGGSHHFAQPRRRLGARRGAPVGRAARVAGGARLFFLASSLRRSALATSARARCVRAAEPLERPSARAERGRGAWRAHQRAVGALRGVSRRHGVRERARSNEKKRQCHVRSAISGTPRKRAYVADRGVRGQRSRGGGDGGGQRRRSRGFRARPRVRGRGGTGGTPRLVGARRPVAGDRGSVPRETDTSATSFFPGKCLNDHEVGARRQTWQHGHVAWPRALAAALDMAPLRDRSARARGPRSCAPAPRRVEYEALSESARARLRKSRARFHQSRTGRTLWVFFFQ